MPEPRNHSDPDDPIDPAVAAIIRGKAARLIGRAGLRPWDREDLEQELALHVLERCGRFRPARGRWPAFVRRLVDRYGENLVRARRAAKRYGGPLAPVPADAPARDADAGARARAVAAAVAALPPELRRVAELVLTGTVTAAAEALGVSRPTVYARLREIRARVEFAELCPDP